MNRTTKGIAAFATGLALAAVTFAGAGAATAQTTDGANPAALQPENVTYVAGSGDVNNDLNDEPTLQVGVGRRIPGPQRATR